MGSSSAAHGQRTDGGQRSAVVGLLAYAALICAFFWRQFFTGQIMAQGDSLLLFYPAWDFRAAALRAGHLPLWNPLTFMGAPFLANSQYGVLYPPNWSLAWLAAPDAVKVSMLVHLLLAAAGARQFARQAAGLRPFPAWFAGSLFELGGYLTARTGQINQLQGLAWLPWALWAASQVRRRPLVYVPLLGLCLGLQILAGHTQTFFITLGAALAYAALCSVYGYWTDKRRAGWSLLAPLGWVVAAAGLAGVLAAGQLIPTLELTRESVRAGGLPVSEVLSFSLDPRLLGHALLPLFTHPLFSEYLATLGITGLCIALIGLLASRSEGEGRVVFALAGLGALGLFFAVGRFNPIFVALARYAPGFNLFRVPARWLALWAFAGAILAGRGLQALTERRASRRDMAACALIVAGLAALAWLARGLTPAGETGPLPPPAVETAAWAATLAAVLLIAWQVRQATIRVWLLAALAVIELFAASLLQPFNQLAPRAAYFDQRPSVAFLEAQAQGQTPPGRSLAQSRLFYDPTREGVELNTLALEEGQTPEAAYQYVVASKYQDVLSHNLALTWGLPTLDGYDGGILPLRSYLEFAEYLLGRPPLTRDGRLRESLDQYPADLPDGRALSLANAQWLITDQTFDAWVNDIYFDLTHHARLAAGEMAAVAALPDFPADGLGVISFLDGAASLPGEAEVATIRVTLDDGQVQAFTLRAGRDTAEGLYNASAAAHSQATVAGHYWPDQQAVNDYVTWFRWTGARRAKSLEVTGTLGEGTVVVRGLTLVNSARSDYAPLVISSTGRYALAFRADVKVYENLDALPRAFVVSEAQVIPSDEEARAAMEAAEFDPARMVILRDGEPLAAPGVSDSAARITEYAPERVVVEAALDQPGYLVLTDAWYPAWSATVDGQPAIIHRADLMFRAVALPAGQHTVTFEYRPRWLWPGFGLSLVGLTAVFIALSQARRRR